MHTVSRRITRSMAAAKALESDHYEYLFMPTSEIQEVFSSVFKSKWTLKDFQDCLASSSDSSTQKTEVWLQTITCLRSGVDESTSFVDPGLKEYKWIITDADAVAKNLDINWQAYARLGVEIRGPVIIAKANCFSEDELQYLRC